MEAPRRLIVSLVMGGALVGLTCLPAQAYAEGGGSVGTYGYSVGGTLLSLSTSCG